ncbi:hypothetical protein MAR_007895 [Mya arenaria]|uniref:Lipoprotein n=1 Tax=Mya arenaria TaxID=6604 RepID=A0ABY7DWZ7_MYAAR|nr:hypothetical protein MAR_007895 [Mya arenaria]
MRCTLIVCVFILALIGSACVPSVEVRDGEQPVDSVDHLKQCPIGEYHVDSVDHLKQCPRW